MTDTPPNKTDADVTETVERLRAEHFPDLDRVLVKELLRLHAPPRPENLSRLVDETIATHLTESH